ncbi:restriction endonuclease subunit S [Mycobacterium angelicum]|uniref:Type I restriction modification DNA specificity domain-containing protein n=1 Tax=Mycobacterium angelicum TaxID=470074 RepID=A0A1W9ZUN4_MYCAN|nr:restriction endonuclease subunit S [Mycobacterium angelicum]MCV7198651.1 restriction endonuclease subunit S [Mycobacterium angelicum]ORA21510.1 hypothetical protein BST12_11860 [Mycobacterium angelicum]
MKWPVVTLGSVSNADGQYGVSLSARQWRTGDPRYIRITDIGADGVLNSVRVAPQGDRRDWEKALLRQGDLLFARSGATVGKTYLHSDSDEPAVYAGYLIKFHPDNNQILPEYLFRYTQTSEYRAWVASSRKAVAQPNINAKQFATLPIPLPPIDEQQRITAILDQADALRAKRRRALAHLYDLAQSIFIDMFGHPDSESSTGPTVRLGEVAGLQGGRNLVANDEAAASEFRVLKISAVTSGQFRGTESKPLPVGYQPPAQHIVRQGDLLISRANTTQLVGAVAYVQDVPKNLVLPDKIWRFVWHDPESVPLYYRALFGTPSIRRRISQLSSGTGGSMKNISKTKLQQLELPAVDIAKQREFARRVAAIPRPGLTELNELFASLQSRAFTGQL